MEISLAPLLVHFEFSFVYSFEATALLLQLHTLFATSLALTVLFELSFGLFLAFACIVYRLVVRAVVFSASRFLDCLDCGSHFAFSNTATLLTKKNEHVCYCKQTYLNINKKVGFRL